MDSATFHSSPAGPAIVIDGHSRIPADVFTFERFRRWAHSDDFPERGKVSFLGGEVNFDLSPENIETHNKVKTAIVAGLGAALAEQPAGDLLSDGALLTNKRAGLAVEPDVMFCGWESLRAGRVKYVPQAAGSQQLVEVSGTPDLVVEIVSPSSVRKDTRQLLELYFAAGIPEYWLIDARREAISFQLLVRNKSKFTALRPDKQGFRKSPDFDRRFQLTRQVNPVGGYSYALLNRA